jgi:hypothetical protein
VPKSEIGNELTIPFDVSSLEVLEKTPTTPDHLEKAAATVVVFLVRVEVGPEVVDTGRKDRDLHRGTSTIVLVELILLDDFLPDDRHVGVVPPRESVAAGEAMLL